MPSDDAVRQSDARLFKSAELLGDGLRKMYNWRELSLISQQR